MTLRFLIKSDLTLLGPKFENPRELQYGFAFFILAEDQEGRRFEHFYQARSRKDTVPPVMWRLLHRIQKAKFKSFDQLSRDYWKETYPNPNSKAGREFAADMERIDRAQDERDNRYAAEARA